MTINRRTAMRRLVFISAGAALLPSCLGDHSKPDLVLGKFTVSGPGQRTLDDCSSKADQDSFFKGLRQLDEASRKIAGRAFAEATASQRESMLAAIGEKKVPGDDLHFFYPTVRKLTILCYTSSPWYITKVQVFELVPGRWHGCMPVSPSQLSS